LSAFADPEEAFRRRGAPFTFDVDSFIEMVRLLSCSPVADHDDPSQDLWLPSFDHAKQDPVPFDIRIPTTTRVVILEGNYVLLNQHPWSQIGEMSDERYATSEDLPRESSLTTCTDGSSMPLATSPSEGSRSDI